MPEKVEEPPKEDVKPIKEEPENPGVKKEADDKAQKENETKTTEDKAANKTEKVEKEKEKEKKPSLVTLKEPIPSSEVGLGPKTLDGDKLSESVKK